MGRRTVPIQGPAEVEEEIARLKVRNLALGHAVQTGVAYAMENPSDTAATPKHLRTGLNISMCDHGGLVGLLIRKGVITDLEYWRASVEMLEAEVAKYEGELSERMGAKITLA